MNSRAIIRTTSLLSLVVALAVFGSVPASFAATKATTKPKVAAKVAPKATAKASVKKTTTTPKAKITKPPVPGSGVERGGRFANMTTAQRACLVKAGVTLAAPRTGVPSARPTSNPSRSPGGFGTRGAFNNPKTIAAFKKCGVVLPTGGFGAQFNSPKFVAFQKCMTAAGFQPAGGFGRYDESDPSTVAALIKCQKSSGFTLPKPGVNN